MSEIYQIIGLVTLLTAFTILLMSKTCVRDELIMHTPKFISKMFSCDFCLGFWTAMLYCLVLFILTGDLGYFVIPFFSAPLIRLLI